MEAVLRFQKILSKLKGVSIQLLACFPRLNDVASYPYLLMHALPDRSLSLLLLLVLYAICGVSVVSVLTSVDSYQAVLAKVLCNKELLHGI